MNDEGTKRVWLPHLRILGRGVLPFRPVGTWGRNSSAEEDWTLDLASLALHTITKGAEDHPGIYTVFSIAQNIVKQGWHGQALCQDQTLEFTAHSGSDPLFPIHCLMWSITH